MDSAPTISAAATARQLGTSVPRVKRAIERLGLDVEEGPAGRVKLSPRQVDRLRDELGSDVEAPGLSRAEVRVLAALADAPLGLASNRAIARRAGVSPTTVGRALGGLEQEGLVSRERVTLAEGRARERDLVRADVTSPLWPEVVPALAHVVAPKRGTKRARRVPPRLRHLFWNTAPAQLEIAHGGDYIARRLLQTGDLEGLAWGAANLRPGHWRHAATARGLDPRRRAMARNLAGDFQ